MRDRLYTEAPCSASACGDWVAKRDETVAFRPPHPPRARPDVDAQGWHQHHHLRHACTFYDVHALMAFVAMMAIEEDGVASNGGGIGQQAANAWRERAEGMIDSMRDYVKGRAGGAGGGGDGGGSGGGSSARERYARDGTPSRVVELHSFPPGRGQEGSESLARISSGGGVEGRGGEGPAAGGSPDNLWVAEHLGLPLCEAILAYKEVRETATCGSHEGKLSSESR